MASRTSKVLVGSLAIAFVAMIIVWRLVKPRPPTVVEGFTAFASFRASDPPGTVYRISANGDIRKVIALPVQVHKAAEVTYEISGTREFSAEQILRVVADTGTCSPVSANFNPKAKGMVKVSSIEGEREYTFDAELEKNLVELRRMFIDKKITYRPDESYWIVRETIRTTNVNYSSSSGWLANADAEATLKSCAKKSISAGGKLEFNWNESNNVSLNRTFNEPLRGWYLADRLTLEIPFGAAPGTEVPNINIVKRDRSSPEPGF